MTKEEAQKELFFLDMKDFWSKSDYKKADELAAIIFDNTE